MNIYVGNLSYSTGEQDLKELFGQYGQVVSSSVIMDRVTGRSRGFGFVEMADDADAEKAIDEINDKEVQGRTLKVNQAKERGLTGKSIIDEIAGYRERKRKEK